MEGNAAARPAVAGMVTPRPLWYSGHSMSGKDARLRWDELARRHIASCSIFDLIAVERSSAEGRRGEFWILSAPDWVNIVPVLRPDSGPPCFVMVRQYRQGAQAITTEFPAGLIEKGEAPADAAARELREETGYRAGRLTLIGDVLPNPAFMTNRCYTFLAEDLHAAGGQSLDELETIDAVTRPIDRVEAEAGTGELVNSLTLVALLAYQRHRAGPS